MYALIIAGLGIGLLGSFHCVGMCGPLALSLPYGNAGKARRFFAMMCYNLGRTFTYFSLGLLFGAIGRSFALVGYQQGLSIATGVLLLIVLLFGRKLQSGVPVLYRFHNKVKKILGQLLRRPANPGIFFLTGVVNGLLPCGLVYLAIASAVATGSAWQGGVVMAAFGLGTIPLMLLLMMGGAYFPTVWRTRVRKLVPVFVGLVACVLILRGLNLGIPYVSPALPREKATEVIICHPDSVSIGTMKR
ncbi:MAG: sulfite exporter TauE/SafE family protein [Niabella sp.]